jgi:uncharacterized membrane protein YecN with MAPEG domain
MAQVGRSLFHRASEKFAFASSVAGRGVDYLAEALVVFAAVALAQVSAWWCVVLRRTVLFVCMVMRSKRNGTIFN